MIDKDDNKTKYLNAFDFYYSMTTLKNVLRSGWVQWNVQGTRVESIAEHSWGTQILAISLFSEFYLNVDLYKVLLMLSLHETEEVLIGDITPFDGVSPEMKLKLGQNAVKTLTQNLTKGSFFSSIIKEFDEGKTLESKFAYICDKLECDLQAKKYSDEGFCTIEAAQDTLNLEERQQLKELLKDCKTPIDAFLKNDEIKYRDTLFNDVVEFLKNYKIKEI